jgi:hypothetical protein
MFSTRNFDFDYALLDVLPGWRETMEEFQLQAL